MLSLDVTGG